MTILLYLAIGNQNLCINLIIVRADPKCKCALTRGTESPSMG
jgi:hypothetical protein